jgi:hypothetical protein
MNRDRRTFLQMAGAAVLVGPASHLARGQSTAKVFVPHASWDCGMKDGIPNPESGVLVFEVQMKLGLLARIGKTPYGDRRVAVGLEGSLSGPKLAGKVMTGALDYELTLSSGTVEVEDLLVFQTDDGKYIYSRSAGVGAGSKDIRIAMDFEAPNGSASEWLNTGKYVARRILDEPAKTLTLRVYDVSNVAVKTDAANGIRIAKPDGVPPQPWNFRQKDASEKPGKELIVESVGLSPSQRVGASKRGNRNIIPITGGDLSGRITGKVLPGGADYQNLSGPPAIDAHYLWQASDGEIIIVRNTTSALGGLVPSFETRVDGPYAYLNTGKFLSSNPGMANGGVKITMYDSSN